MKKKTALLILIVVLTILCAIVAGLLLWPKSYDPSEVEQDVQTAVSEAYEEQTDVEDYVSPVDFESLQSQNPDIYAWLYIPGTEISYPVVQSASDDEYYLTHGSDGEEATNGAIYTEKTYTSTDFCDPVTVVYGHRINDGSMFGQLQTLYSSSGGIEQYNDVVVYLPDSELHYSVFAAVPYDSRHILNTYNFDIASMFDSFMDSVLSVRDIGAQFYEADSVTEEDQLLVLSTCLYGDSEQRYLVLAKLVEIYE